VPLATVGRWSVLALIAAAAALPFFVERLPHFQFTQALVCHRAAGPEHPHRLQRPDLARARRSTRSALHRGDLDGPVREPVLGLIPIGGAVCLVFGFLFGLPALRLHGHYLALATFALAVAMPQILKYKAIEGWTGGVQGIVIIKPDPPAGLPVSQDQWLYFFTLAIAIVLFVLAWNLIHSRVGRALMAIRDQPIAAEAMGVNTAFYKSWLSGSSALHRHRR
jgi:branched-chain amino acid transport system permease protein